MQDLAGALARSEEPEALVPDISQAPAPQNLIETVSPERTGGNASTSDGTGTGLIAWGVTAAVLVVVVLVAIWFFKRRNQNSGRTALHSGKINVRFNSCSSFLTLYGISVH
jgi:hypothetical protein